jgi:HPt (histidine-containing phosphotransfer) domain-containing protein
MDDYLPKPFELEQLRAVLERVMTRRRSGSEDASMPPLVAMTPPPSPGMIARPFAAAAVQAAPAPPIALAPATPPSMSAVVQRVSDDSVQTPLVCSPGLMTQPVLDETTVAMFRGLDQDGSSWRSLVSLFVASQPQRTPALREHFGQIQTGLTALSQAAHSLKGGASGIGAMRLASAADIVEKAARARVVPRMTDVEAVERESVLACQALQRTIL